MFLISEVLQSGRVRLRHDTKAEAHACDKCAGTEWALSRQKAQNGAMHIRAGCACGTGGPFVPRSQLRFARIEVSALPLVPAADGGFPGECAVCGLDEVEWHHVAPRALFGDEAELWPVVALCIPHHVQWHRVLTPGDGSSRARPVCDLSSEIMDRIRAAKRARAGETVCDLCASRTWSFFDYAPIHLLKHWKNGITGHLCNRCAARWEAHFPVLAQRR
jgi:hypothetical protein